MNILLPSEHELNSRRRSRAASALRAHQGGRLDGVVSFQEAVTDLFADIMHLRDAECAQLSELHLESAWHNAKRLYYGECRHEADEQDNGVAPAESRDENGGAQ